MDSPPKETDASKTKALQFLVGSHLAWKLLDGSTQKEKQTETQGLVLNALSPHLVGCLPGRAGTQVFTPHGKKHQALNYPNRASRITRGHTSH